MTQFDFANSANWEQVSYTSKFADQPTLNHFVPIPEMDVSGAVLLNSSIIATFATCSTAKPTWNTAGWLYQNVQSGLSVGGNLDATIYGNRRVPLNRIQIHFWDRGVKNYKLTFRIPKWIYQISLTVWVYIGPVTDAALDALELTRIDILRTEAKVDALFKDWIQ